MGSNRARPVEVPPEVLRLRDELVKRFRIERMILFGSRARREHLTTSDVDLVVVSPDFAGVPFLKRIREVVALWESDLDLEVLPYTPEEFERKRREIGIVAVAEGIEIPPPHPRLSHKGRGRGGGRGFHLNPKAGEPCYLLPLGP